MSARERILDGAVAVMRSQGLARSTTKEIAKAAGLSEAMLYKVFRDKVELFLAVLNERLPRIAVLADGPSAYLGRSTVEDALRRVVAEILAFYLESFPVAASVFSDPELLARHRHAVGERGAGPQRVVEGVADYLAAEQAAGRVGAEVKTRTVAELLVGACLHRAFLAGFAGKPMTPAQVRRFATEQVAALRCALV